MQELRISTPDNKVQRVALDQEAISLGRAHTNDLCYPDDASLSRRHLLIEPGGDGWTVTDLNSKNGTILNGARITGKHPLKLGDRIVVGQLSIACADPAEDTDTGVVFVTSTAPETAQSSTVMTSLEGLLSGDSTEPARTAHDSNEVTPERQFRLPIVRALIRAGRELAGRLSLEELFSLILSQAIEAVKAERGVLMTLEGDKLRQQAIHGEGLRISTTVRDRVLKKRESLLVRDVGQEEALHKQLSITEQQIHSLIAVPLQTQESVIGLIYVDSRLFVREFTANDLNLLTVLANVAAIRIDHERHLELQRKEQRRTLDLQQAAEIQEGILPQTPTVEGLDLDGHNAPCRTVGGDYYDFIPYADGRLAMVLGDVAGKGMAAALLMSSLQARVRLLTETPSPLAALMTRLDRSIAASCPRNRFITLFMCIIDPASGRVVYCNAGHNPALVVRASGKVEPLEAVGTVLGILPDLGYEEQQDRLGPGDLIAIYSDGITEAIGDNGDEFGQERLAEILVRERERSASEILTAVKTRLAEWCGPEGAEDDVTLVVARRTSG